MGENLEVVWAKFSTLIQAVLLITPKLCNMQMATSKVENSAQFLFCKLKFVYGLFYIRKYHRLGQVSKCKSRKTDLPTPTFGRSFGHFFRKQTGKRDFKTFLFICHRHWGKVSWSVCILLSSEHTWTNVINFFTAIIYFLYSTFIQNYECS